MAITALDLVEAFAHSSFELLASASSNPGQLGLAASALAGFLDGKRGRGWEAFDAAFDLTQTWADLHPDLQICLVYAASARCEMLGRHADGAVLLPRLQRLLSTETSPLARGMVHRREFRLALLDNDVPRALAATTTALAAFAVGSDLWAEFLYHDVLSRIDDLDLWTAERGLLALRQHPEVLRRCGIVITQLEDGFDLAAGEPQRVLDQQTASPPGPWHLGLALIETRRFAAARRHIAGLVKDAATMAISTMGGQLACLCAIRQGRAADADALLRQTGADTIERDRRWILPMALQLALDQRAATAARAALETLDADRHHGRFLFAWARLLLLEGDVDGAQDAFARLRLRGPERMVLNLIRHARELTPGSVSLLWAGGARTPRPGGPQTPRSAVPAATLIGDSADMGAVRAWIERAATVQTPVLIVGETGTGKEIAARLLHRQGGAKEEPFIALNCGAISDSLAEAELFGHAAGAFTGAVKGSDGLIVAAGRGTLFLDEINSLSLRLQAMLLRLLEDGEFRLVGGTANRRAECRIVVASNQELADAVAAGSFRADLRYRLERLVLTMPALRDHAADIPLLAAHFLRQCTSDPAARLEDAVISELKSRSWPGNVRELRNEIERLVLFGSVRAPRLIRGGRPHRPAPTAPTPPARQDPPAAAHIPGLPAARERRRRVLDLVDRLGEIYAADVIAETGSSAATAAADLAALAEIGLLRRVIRGGHPRVNPYLRA